MGSSMPGVSRNSATSMPFASSLTEPTSVVVAGLGETEPNAASRESVRISEVLPALVWPTTATMRICC